jgi:hypothetical protein
MPWPTPDAANGGQINRAVVTLSADVPAFEMISS